MTGLGTIDWIGRTGGRLAWHERLTLLAQAVRALAGSAMQKRSGRKIRLLEVDDIMPPDSQVAREAIALSYELSKPVLFNHCVRSYFWARLLDEDNRCFDDEAVLTALMLHDLGLTEEGARTKNARHCFTQIGALRAYDLAQKHGWSDRRADLAANAIALHLNVLVAYRHGKEASMVRAGSCADVTGFGLRRLHQDQIDEVVSRIPRIGLKREMKARLIDESRSRPDSRIAFLCDRLNFGQMIERSAVFSE